MDKSAFARHVLDHDKTAYEKTIAFKAAICINRLYMPNAFDSVCFDTKILPRVH